MKNAGDKCPQCKVGLLEATSTGLECNHCGYEVTIEELEAKAIAARTAIGDYKFKSATLSLRLEDPEDAEVFVQGCILARQHNNSPLWDQLIDGVNGLLEPWRAARLQAELEARGS